MQENKTASPFALLKPTVRFKILPEINSPTTSQTNSLWFYHRPQPNKWLRHLLQHFARRSKSSMRNVDSNNVRHNLAKQLIILLMVVVHTRQMHNQNTYNCSLLTCLASSNYAKDFILSPSPFLTTKLPCARVPSLGWQARRETMKKKEECQTQPPGELQLASSCAMSSLECASSITRGATTDDGSTTAPRVNERKSRRTQLVSRHGLTRFCVPHTPSSDSLHCSP
jgi:hypothetical protein